MIRPLEVILIGIAMGALLGAILGRFIQRRRSTDAPATKPVGIILLGALLGGSAGMAVGSLMGEGLGAVEDLPAITTPEEYDEIVLGSDKPAMLFLYTPSCPYCHHTAPIVRQLADEYGDRISVATLNMAGVDDINLINRIPARDNEGVPRILLFRRVPDTRLPDIEYAYGILGDLIGSETMDADQIRQILDNAIAETHTGE